MTNAIAKTIPELRFVTSLNVRQNIAFEKVKKILESLQNFSPLASIIFYDPLQDERFLQEKTKFYIDLCQNYHCAVFISQDNRLVFRLKADGLHIEQDQKLLDDALHLKNMPSIGYGPIKNKHHAMEIGEKNPNYLFFGKLGSNFCEKKFQRNYNLALWWSEIMNIPAILQTPPIFEIIQNIYHSPIDFIHLENFFWDSENLNDRLVFLQSLLKN